MNESKVKIIFEDMSYATKYTFLEEGKDDKELKEIAKKRGIVLPSPDLAIFKGRYAFVDRQNKNGCTLPRQEVEKALGTLALKAVDIDHLRRSVIGTWLDAKLEDDEIITYGSFMKSNFQEEYKDFKEKMESGTVKISFEAWGDRLYHDIDDTTKGYDLTSIHFAGGALLFNTKPAFADAEVLEFAKVLDEDGLNFGEGSPNKVEPTVDQEESKLNFYHDRDIIARMMFETKCPSCQEKGWFDILNIDLVNMIVKGECISCGGTTWVDLTPTTKIIKKGKKEKSNKDKGGAGMNDKIVKSAEELQKELDALNGVIGVRDKEVAEHKIKITKLEEEAIDVKTKLDKATKDYETIKADLDKRIKVEKDSLIKSRKDELGEEYSKEVSDEDILNDTKFENLKLKKENAEIKAKLPPEKAGLEAGDKTGNSPINDKRKRISEKAFLKS